MTNHKPHPEGLLKAASKLGLPVESCIYMGDSEVDASAARSARMPFMAVRTGSTPVEAFEAYPKRAMLDSVADIVRE